MKSLSIRMAMVVLLITTISYSCSTASNLMGVLGANPNLSGITSLLKGAGGVSSILGGSGPYTLLAPTNDALSKAGGGADLVQNLLKPENKDQLTNLLKHQIVPGNVTSDAIKAGGVKDAAGNVVNLGTATLDQGKKTKDGMVYVVDQLLK